VDIVGDAHKLSSYFENGKQFDIVFSSAVFEHFAMPWIVATEIAKILKVGGFVFWKLIFRLHHTKDHGTSFSLAIWH
jgi:2-polyprenyl-3-methyl-5-hydroxy-6-metoxy-1,4-benzoquinol methylase